MVHDAPHALRPTPSVAWRDALDEVVLLDRATGRSWLLDPAGAAIWRAVVAAGDLEAAVALLPGAEAAEVEAFTHRLVAEGALEEAGG